MNLKTWQKSLLVRPDMAILNDVLLQVLEGRLVYHALSVAIDARELHDLATEKLTEKAGPAPIYHMVATYIQRIRGWANQFAKYDNTLGKNWMRKGKSYSKSRAKLISDFITACEKAGVAEFKEAAKVAAALKKAKEKQKAQELKVKMALKKKPKKKLAKGDPGVTENECVAAEISMSTEPQSEAGKAAAEAEKNGTDPYLAGITAKSTKDDLLDAVMNGSVQIG